MFVGLIELMLEFVKPLTLSMRLFGNIYGGEVALGVILALTVAFVPVALYGLELMLNLVQALIFSVLTLMFILAAIEGHGHDDAHEPAHEGAAPQRRRDARGSGSGTRPLTKVPNQSRRRSPGKQEERHSMELIGAGLAALGVIGPGIGIGILGGMSNSAIGRNPDAAGQIRGLAIILAAFAEGLGVLAVVVGLLAIFLSPAAA